MHAPPRPGPRKIAARTAPAPKTFKTALPRPENAPSLTVSRPAPRILPLPRPTLKQKNAAPCIPEVNALPIWQRVLIQSSQNLAFKEWVWYRAAQWIKPIFWYWNIQEVVWVLQRVVSWLNTSKHHPRPLAAVLIENFSVFRFSFTQTNNYLSLGLFTFSSFASVSQRPTIIVSHAKNNLLLGPFIFAIIIINSHFTTNSKESQAMQCSQWLPVISITSYGQQLFH